MRIQGRWKQVAFETKSGEKTGENMKKRVLSRLLCFLLVLSLVSLPAFAEDGESADTQTVSNDSTNGGENLMVAANTNYGRSYDPVSYTHLTLPTT